MVNTAQKIHDRIRELKQEAALTGDYPTVRLCEMADLCALYDSDTRDIIEPEELFAEEDHPMLLYVDAIVRFVQAGTRTRHVYANGRAVYAQ